MTGPKYNINVFWSADDDCWIADVPDLKCCSAHGETPNEAMAEVQVAIALWLEVARDMGTSIPEPRYRPANYAAKFAQCVMVFARNLLPNSHAGQLLVTEFQRSMFRRAT